MAFPNRRDASGGVSSAQVITLIQSKVQIGVAMVNVSPGVWSIPSGTVFGTMIDIYDGGGLLAYGVDYTFASGTTATFVNGPAGTPVANYVLQ